MDKIINTYEASAADGAKVTVYEVQDMDRAGTVSDPSRMEAGTKRMQLSDGRPLEMVGDREFKIVGSDEVFLLDRPYSP
jgi:hypothetical protein